MSLTAAKVRELRKLFDDIQLILKDPKNKKVSAKVFRTIQLTVPRVSPHVLKFNESLEKLREEYCIKLEDGSYQSHQEIMEGGKTQNVLDFKGADEAEQKINKDAFVRKSDELLNKEVKIDFMQLSMRDMENLYLDTELSDYRAFFKFLVDEQS